MMEEVLRAGRNFLGWVIAILYALCLLAIFIHDVSDVGYQNLMILTVLTIGVVCGLTYFIKRANRDGYIKTFTEQKLYQSFIIHTLTAWLLLWVQAATTLGWYKHFHF